jgi:Ni/Fe-hydrogenase subunit HybB-like protein
VADRNLSSGYAERTITKAPNWHSLVAVDVFLNNLTTGLFMVVATAELIDRAAFSGIARWSYALALALLLLDFLCLVLDLGHHSRFHHMLRVFKPGSPMSLGTWCLTIYSVLLAIIVLEQLGTLLRVDLKQLHPLLVVAALPFAFGSAAYKGVLFSTSAQPGWKDARWLGAYLINSAAVLGAGIALLIASALGEAGNPSTSALRRALLVLICPFNLLLYYLLLVEVSRSMRGIRMRRDRTFLFSALVCSLIEIILLLEGSTISVAAAVALLLATHLAIRFGIVWLPHLAE